MPGEIHSKFKATAERLLDLLTNPPRGILVLDPDKPPTADEIQEKMIDGIVLVTTPESIAQAVDERWPLLHVNYITGPDAHLTILDRYPVGLRTSAPHGWQVNTELEDGIWNTHLDINVPDLPPVRVKIPEELQRMIRLGYRFVSMDHVEDNIWIFTMAPRPRPIPTSWKALTWPCPFSWCLGTKEDHELKWERHPTPQPPTENATG